MSNISHDFYVQPMNQVYIETLVMYVAWTVAMLLLRGRARKVVGIIGALLAFALIMGFTLFGRSNGKDEVSLIPFISFVNAKTQPELYRTMFMNMLLFLPLGLSLPYALPDKIKHKALVSITSGLILSVFVEALQFVFHMGRCETDDVLMNTLGMLIGASAYFIFLTLTKRKN